MGRTISRSGFTLVELLTVIAILALLAAILFPVFARAKRQAQLASCVSNVKQIGVAMGIYAGDYDDRFPHAVDAADRHAPEIWAPFPEFRSRISTMPMLHETLMPYVKEPEIFRSPADDGTEVLDTHPYIAFPSSPSMYEQWGTSYMFRTEIAFRQLQQTQFELPTDVNVLFSGAGHWHGDGGKLRMGEGRVYEKLDRYRYVTLFGDFRAESITYAELQEAWATRL